MCAVGGRARAAAQHLARSPVQTEEAQAKKNKKIKPPNMILIVLAVAEKKESVKANSARSFFVVS